jgi:hypothetical protein
MFELEKALNQWKAKLYKSNSFCESDILELEGHLIDEFNSLMNTKDLSEEEAFLVSCSRIGSVELLSEEFEKVNLRSIWFRKIFMFFCGYILISFLQKFITLLSILLTVSFSKIQPLSKIKLEYSNLAISTFITLLLLGILFTSKFTLISKTYNKISKLFYNNKLIFIFCLLIITLFSTFSIVFSTPIVLNNLSIEDYGAISQGSNMFAIIWSILLVLSVSILYLKKQTVAKA